MYQSTQFVSAASDFDELLSKARRGCRESRGILLENCRASLLKIARNGIGSDLQAKVAASDLVQESFLSAQRDFGAFQGSTRKALVAWVRSILAHRLKDFAKRFRDAAVRRLDRERSLDAFTACAEDHVEEEVEKKEELQMVLEALQSLPMDCIQVIQLRNLECLSWKEVGTLMGRVSPEAARKLWCRALDQLRQKLVRRGEKQG